MERIARAHVTPAGGGERLRLGQARIGIALAAEHTGGTLALVDYELPGGFPGPPLHVHPAFAEAFVVLAGSVRFRVGDDVVDAEPGAVVYVDGDAPHTFSNPTPEPARFLVALAPAGFEQFFRDLAEAGGAELPDPETAARLNALHGVEAVV